MDLDHLENNSDVLLGDGADPVIPPPLLVPSPAMDISFHPQLPLLAVGMVTGEIAVYECRGSEMVQKPLSNDFASWVFGRKKLYREDEIVVKENNYCMRMHPRGAVTTMEFTDDGAYLVSASSDRTVSVLDCVSTRLMIHITADAVEEGVKNTKKSTRKRTITARPCKILRSREKSFVVTANPHRHGISALNVCDENVVATGDDDGLVALWDMRARKPVHTYHEHGDYVSQLLYFVDVRELVSSSGDTCLGVYDVRGGRIRDFSERRKDEINCFAFINSSGPNSAAFIPSIVCGTPSGSLPIWKYGSWRRPYDALESHPRECESLVSFQGDGAAFNHNILLTGACDGLVRVVQMYPLRRNLCQLSARDYTYAHANPLGFGGDKAGMQAYSNFLVQQQRGHEGITHMRVCHDGRMLAVSGSDNIIDFVDIRFLSDAKALDELRGKTEQRHMNTLRVMEEAEEKRKQQDKEGDTASHLGDGSSSSEASSTTSGEDKVKRDYMEELRISRQQKRERVAAAKWLKEEKKKKINFTYEKRRRRVGGFFGDMVNCD